jgi:predicted N-acetyltransferase YhbS
MEGPRPVRPEEFASLSELADTVFRPGMFAKYPQLFNPDNAENLRVCCVDENDGGRVVSHVGMIQRPATLFGCATRVGGIGAVGTLAAYRGSGLAGACFDDAARKARRDGVDLLLVSGDRSLYRRRGCLRVGDDVSFTLTAATSSGSDSPLVVSLEPLADADLPQARRIYQQEPVRLLRPPSDWDLARKAKP